MSAMVNAGPPAPRSLTQARSGERSWPGEPAWPAPLPRHGDGPVRVWRLRDGQPRSRRRGSTSSL
jgi:hypothetical protein